MKLIGNKLSVELVTTFELSPEDLAEMSAQAAGDMTGIYASQKTAIEPEGATLIIKTVRTRTFTNPAHANLLEFHSAMKRL